MHKIDENLDKKHILHIRLFLISFVVCFMLLVVGVNVVRADSLPIKGVISVKKDGTGDFNRIELALYFSQSGDIIEIQDSETYPETLNLSLYSNMTIRAKEGEHPIIYGRILMGDDCILNGLRITYPYPTREKGGSASTISSSGADRWTVKNCDIYDIPFNSQAFYMANGTQDCKIIFNKIHDGEGSVLYITVNYDKGNNLIANNIIYNCGGISIRSSSPNNKVVSNTIYKSGISCESSTTIVENNIIVSSSFENSGPVSYNCFYNSADITEDGNIVTNPLFVNPAEGDFHLQSEAGRWDGNNWVNDAETSPCIDAGNPSSDCSKEPNGNRINMGTYGDTHYASKSTGAVNTAPPFPEVSISPSSPTQSDNLTCNINNQLPDPDGDTITYIYEWYKNTVHQEDLTTNSVSSSYTEEGDLWKCEVMANDSSLNSIPVVVEVRVQGTISRPDYEGLKTQYCWLQSQIDNLPSEGGVVDIPEGEHTIATTFIDRNTINLRGKGFDKTILKAYASGKIIKVGNNLEEISNITIEQLGFSGGESMNRAVGALYFHETSNIHIENISIKNCDGVYLEWCKPATIAQSKFDNVDGGIFTQLSENIIITNNTFSQTHYWWSIDLQSTRNSTVSQCKFYNCGHGAIKLYSGASNNIISDNLIDAASFHAPIGIFGGNGSIIERNIVRNCRDIGAIVVGYPYHNNDVIIRNNLVYSNEQAGIQFDPNRNKYEDRVLVESNTIYGNGGDGIWIKLDNYYIVTAKNNIIANNSECGIKKESAAIDSIYNDVWNNKSGNYNGISAGTGDISVNPQFVDTENYDFHLKSTTGRWSGSSWVNDDITSPCIDRGDPSSNYSNEQPPNGGRINIGAYGNTVYASKSMGSTNDTVSPTVSIIIPHNGAKVFGRVPIKINATDNFGVTKVELYINDVLTHTFYTSPYEWIWDTKEIPEGEYTIKAIAYDTNDNSSEREITVKVIKVEGIVTYPNPYVKGETSGEGISFANLPKEAIIRIYTVSGDLVKTIKHKDTADGGRKEWDISGIASGVYMYCIESSEGKKKGKMSIIK